MKLIQTGLALLLLLFAGMSWACAHDGDGGKGIGGSGGAGSGGGGPFDYSGMKFHSNLELDQIGNLGFSNVIGNDVWGWTDQTSGREFALMGLTNGTSFIEVTNPDAPVYLGTLKMTNNTVNTAWRDIKVYNNQAYIVADFQNSVAAENKAHGVQVFDLNNLLTASASDPNNPNYFNSVGVYSGVTKAHNIVINEDSGYAYVVGANVANGGLHVLDLNGGVGMPTHVGNFSADGYTHDAQVVNYLGPDAAYVGKEVAFNSNEDSLTIVDVTDKSSMTEISNTGYSNSEYAHQGWLSEDQKYFFMDDELDEYRSDTLIQTRTRVWDVSDLDAPVYLGYHEGNESTIDHNLYVKGDLIFQANYTSGLRVLKINDAATLDLEEIAYFDTFSANNAVNFNGAWSVFPYFDSGTVLVSDRQGGLFVLSVVPEPGTGMLLGMLGLACFARRRRAS